MFIGYIMMESTLYLNIHCVVVTYGRYHPMTKAWLRNLNNESLAIVRFINRAWALVASTVGNFRPGMWHS